MPTRHLLHCWDQVGKQLRSARTVALFLDFDGTLTRLRPRPEEVWLDSSTRRALGVLARSRRFRVWVVSGRRQADVRARIRVPGIRYLGLHGWEGATFGESVSNNSAAALAHAKAWMSASLAALPGVWVEDKEFILAVHYRSAPEFSVRCAHQIVQGVVRRSSDSLRLAGGNKVWEVMPLEVKDKGAAVRHELASVSGPAVPVYVGDDAGDEPAFKVLSNGITIRVGPARASRAKYRLSNAAQVRLFLEKLSGVAANERHRTSSNGLPDFERGFGGAAGLGFCGIAGSDVSL